MDTSNDGEDGDRRIPRMPFERDQSSDSQQRRPDEVIEKAYRDIEEGRQDTDRRGIRGYEKPENRIAHKEKEKRDPTKRRAQKRA
ncbi:MAG: hypothetical protein M9885_06915 [Burkholderiaceae bacterium]|nr:hypothetical protein [Burkholderiaceae bacterium]